jgi:hypothetical protein
MAFTSGGAEMLVGNLCVLQPIRCASSPRRGRLNVRLARSGHGGDVNDQSGGFKEPVILARYRVVQLLATGASFDHLVGAGEQGRRHIDG